MKDRFILLFFLSALLALLGSSELAAKGQPLRTERVELDATHYMERVVNEETQQLVSERYYENGQLINTIHFWDLGEWGLFRQGEQLLAQNDFKAARPILEQAIAERPGHSLVHFKLGVVYERLKLFAEAKAQYEQAIACQDQIAWKEASIGLGNTLLWLRDFQKAESIFQSVLAKDSRDSGARYGVAYAYSSLARWSECLKILDELIAEDPQHQSAIALKNWVLRQR